jgi:large subunit ribosomal protein L20
MSRVKGGLMANKKRKNILKDAKGFRFARSKTVKGAKDALRHAGAYAFAHRRDKKNDFRRLWTVRLNAALREAGTTFSVFQSKMNKAHIILNRKMLSELAHNHPESFKRVISKVK